MSPVLRRYPLFLLALTLTFATALLEACSRQSRPTASAVQQGKSLIAFSQPVLPPVADPRTYGWDRLKEVLSADWQSWSTKCETAPTVAASLPGSPQMNVSNDCSVLRQVRLSPDFTAAQLTPQDPDSSLHLASVLFNDVAARSILKYNIGLPTAGAKDPLAAGGPGTRSVTPLDSNSIVVKAIWEVVNPENSKWPLRVYDPLHLNVATRSSDGTPTELLPIVGDTPVDPQWTSIINLDTSSAPCSFQENAPPADIELGTTLPINCFVHHLITQKIIGRSLIRTSNKPASANYYLILVGLHVARKDDSAWTWTTFWFTNRPSKDPDHFAGQPFDLPAIYNHFAMNTTVSGSPVCFNPYQEGPEGANSMQSNCIQCHSLAAIRTVDTDAGLGLPHSGPGVPAGYFAGAVTTDSIWSIATARNNQSDSGFRLVIRKPIFPTLASPHSH